MITFGFLLVLLSPLLFVVTTAAWTTETTSVSRCLERIRYPTFNVMNRRQPFGLLLATAAKLHDDIDDSRRQKDAIQDSSMHTIKLDSGNVVPVVPRAVPVTSNWTINVFEWSKPASIVEAYWDAHGRMLGSSGQLATGAGNQLLDPFGLVCWPGSLVAAQEMLRNRDQIQNQTVLVLGAGVGVEAQAAALLGAKRVVATDVHPTTLKLLEYGARHAGVEDVVEARVFDLFAHDGESPIPDSDILIAADILYNDKLSSQVCRRCVEALSKNPRLKVLVTDSQRFVDFTTELNERLKKEQIGISMVEWKPRTLEDFTGSGVIVDDDQTYDVEARVVRIGWS